MYGLKLAIRFLETLVNIIHPVISVLIYMILLAKRPCVAFIKYFKYLTIFTQGQMINYCTRYVKLFSMNKSYDQMH